MNQFLYGFLAVIIIPSVALFAAGYTGLIEKITPLVVQSGSMEPVIKTGSAVFVQKSPNYKTGDVIAFKPEGNKNLVAHRVVSNDGKTFQTKGDANEEADPWKISQNQIAGKIVYYIPYVGFGVDFAKQPKGFVLIVIIPAAIIIWEELKVLLGELIKVFSKAHPAKAFSGSPKIMMIVPLIGFFFVVVAVSGAFFLDSDKSINNILGAADSFATAELVTPNLVVNPPEATQSATPSAQFTP